MFLVKFNHKKSPPKKFPKSETFAEYAKIKDCRIGEVLKALSYLDIVFASMNRTLMYS
jgi:hypothetical protein